MKRINPIWWVIIALLFLGSGIAVIIVNNTVFTVSWMIFWVILGGIFTFLIFKNRPEAKLFDEKGKEVTREEAMLMADKELKIKYQEMWSKNQLPQERTMMAGEAPASPIYLKIGRGYWDTKIHYLFGVNGKHADRIITMPYKLIKPFTEDEIKKIANDLTEKPERLEVVKYGSERDEFGIDKPTTTVTRPTREQHARQQANDEIDARTTLESDIPLEGSE